MMLFFKKIQQSRLYYFSLIVVLILVISATTAFFASKSKLSAPDNKKLYYEMKNSLEERGFSLNYTYGVSMSVDNYCRINLVVEKELDEEQELKIGSQYTFRKSGNDKVLVAHRLMRIERDKEKKIYYFKGDNPITNASEDKPVERERVLTEHVSILKTKVLDYSLDDCYKIEVMNDDERARFLFEEDYVPKLIE